MSVQIGRLPTDYMYSAPAREDLNVFEGRRIMLSLDLDIQDHLRRTIEQLIRKGGGKVSVTISQADVLVCQYREGDDYQAASLEGKVVGNLPWLYHLITHNSWTSPLRRLLHYPIVRGGLPGFKKFRISLSNYNGEARIYLENLAKAAGCEFTKTMKMDNTHLITAHTLSEKCEAAKEWNINMCNHLWLEESYAKWQIQNLTNPRYTHFPPRTNLSEVVGQTPIDRDALERNFFSRPSEPLEELPRPMQQKDHNATKPAVLNSSAIQPQTSSDDRNQTSRLVQSDGLTPRAPKQDRRHSDGATLRTPAPSRLRPDNKENETPSTSGSRGAKARAAAKLHEMAPDIALYEKERKRVGGVTHGGRRKGDAKSPEPSRKRSVSSEDSDELGRIDGRPGKRGRKGKAPTSIRLLVTGHREWNENPKAEMEARVRAEWYLFCYLALTALSGTLTGIGNYDHNRCGKLLSRCSFTNSAYCEIHSRSSLCSRHRFARFPA